MHPLAADLPVAEVIRLAGQVGAGLVVLSSATTSADRRARSAARGITAALPDVTVPTGQPGRGVAFHAMHPGWADTPGVAAALPRFRRVMRPLLRTPEQGADTITWLATADPALLGSGGFWHDRRRRPEHLLPWTREDASARDLLWDRCARAAVIAPPVPFGVESDTGGHGS